MNRTAHRETQCRQAVHKLIISLHSEWYRPSGMLIHRKHLYAPRGEQRTGHRKAQSRESRKLSVFVPKFHETYKIMKGR
jgi:hypothetical protein